MSEWVLNVSEMLSHLADTLHPTSFDTLRAADFAPLKSLLERAI
jgi:hypothetical protein